MSQLLLDKISAVRQKRAVLVAGRGAAIVAGLVIVLLAISMLLDWWLELPRWLRGVLLAVDLAAAAYALFQMVIAPVVFGPDDDELALTIERAMPEFRTRLIAAVQLGRPDAAPAGASPGLVRALVHQTEQLARPMDFTRVIPADDFLRAAIIVVLIVLTAAAAFVYRRDVSGDLLRRALLANIPVPRNTRVTCLTLDPVIAIGDSITLEATAGGLIPPDGRVDIRYASGRSQSFTMERTGSRREARFSRPIENVQESFTYVIRLNDGHSARHQVTAVARPTASALDMTQSYPGYTRHPPEKRSPGDLSLLAGSKLAVRVRASKPLREAYLRLVGLEKDVPLAIGAEKAEAWGQIDIPAKGMSGLSIRLVDTYGITSKNETVYPVDVVPDRDPAVRVLYPDRKEELATQQARMLISFEASDDYGIAGVRVKYKVENGEQEGEKELEIGAPADPRRIRFRYELDLAQIRPMVPEGGAVEYWVEVQDVNDVTGPGRAASDRYRAKIVSEIEKRADLMNRLNDHLGTIDVVTQDQEKLNQALGKLVTEKK